ncbi:MAG: carboxypeptidase regulatory-like domain-containing protein [Bacteroidales bacterium]|nr:carboxypeptidase regulatory-like domain-containing protein [Bacteroidales bacterium]
MVKKVIEKVLFVIIMTVAVVIVTRCTSNHGAKEGFVYIEDGVFKVDGEQFFPLMLNYKVDMMTFGDDLVLGAVKYYDNPEIYEPTTKQEALDQFSSHMQIVEDLGFNTVRLCLNVISANDKGRYFSVQSGVVYLKDKTDQILDAVEEMVSIVASHNMKVMLLLKPSWDAELAKFNSALMKRLSNEKTVFAYDLMNEPLYFDEVKDRLKADAVDLVGKWVDKAKTDAPNHLFTIGFAEPIEVFSWDPSIMPVDFIEIHTYNPLSIPNEIWWYSHYVKKPWMIGETSLPADDDSVSYEQQCFFAEQAYQYTIDCGGIGFGWWAFQDFSQSDDINYEGIYSGVLNHEGTMTTQNGYVIQGTLKPVAYSFAGLKSLKKGEPEKAVNYYNNFGYHNAKITGRIVNYKGEPIEGAVIRGWNNTWRTGLNTFTDENGVFNLYSNDECVHFAISAPGYDTKRFDMYLEYRDANGANSDFTDLPDRNIKSSMVSFGKFLKEENKLFDFKEDEFNKAVIFADMGVIKLEMLGK